MYLATQYTWSSVRDLHAAVLFEIECDRAKWGDSFTYLESRILQSLSRSSHSGSGAPCSENPASVFFCHDFQHGMCKHQKDHFGTLRGERKWFQHICARCWVDSRLLARHSEFAKECHSFSRWENFPEISLGQGTCWLTLSQFHCRLAVSKALAVRYDELLSAYKLTAVTLDCW